MLSVETKQKIDKTKASSAQVLRLHQLDLDESVAPHLQGIECLTHLDLALNRFTTVPDSIINISSKLKVLEMSANRITTVSPQISKLKHLRELHLLNNQITCLPPEIVSLKHTLTQLSLSSNKLTQIPPEIFQLRQLEILWLSYNNGITSLPSELFTGLPNIKKFSCGFNSLTSINPNIKYWKNVEKLVLKCNKLKFLPAEILQLPLLTCFEINENPLLAQSSFENELNITQKVPSLLEIAARKIVTTHPESVINKLPHDLLSTLSDSQPCSLCGEPYFFFNFHVISFNSIGESNYFPVLHRLCCWGCVEELEKKHQIYHTTIDQLEQCEGSIQVEAE